MDGFDIHDPEFRRLVLPNAPLVKLGEGFAWLEGPVWFADHGRLLVSDLPGDRILRWSEGCGISVFRQPSGFANGHTRDQQGRLLGCSHQHRCVTRTELDGSITVLASHYEGRPLNGPNDIICRSDGTVWFSDPHYGGNTDYEGGKHRCELPPALYRLDPRSGSLQVMAGDFEGPNGLCFSPDERLLYVAETGQQFAEHPVRHIRVFDVLDDGARLSGGRVFHAVSPGNADLDQRRGRRPLRRPGRAPAGPHQGAVPGVQPRIWRTQPRPAVHLRFAHVVCHLYQHAGRQAAAATGARHPADT